MALSLCNLRIARTLVLITLLLAYFKTIHAHPLKNATNTPSNYFAKKRFNIFEQHLPLESMVANALQKKTLDTSRQQQELSQNGLTLDACKQNEDCRETSSGNRTCVVFSDPESSNCPPSAVGCQCAPAFDPKCKENSECDEGEICATRIADEFTFCVSATFVSENPFGIIPVELAPEGGLTAASCSSADECRGDRICAEGYLEGTSCPEGKDCFCFPDGPLARCAVDWDCQVGEACAVISTPESNLTKSELRQNDTLHGFCFSTEALNTSIESVYGISEVYEFESEELGVQGEPGRMKLSYDRCENQSECKHGTICTADRFGEDRCDLRGCRCFPDPDKVCVENSECDEGEVCAGLNESFGIGVCISQAVVDRVTPALEELENGNSILPPGLTGDRCLFDSDCESPRRCEEDTAVERICPVWGVCFCFQPATVSISCDTQEDCVQGERCFAGLSQPVCLSEAAGDASGQFVQISPSPSPSPSIEAPSEERDAAGGAMVPTSTVEESGPILTPEVVEEGCVDARMIADLDREDLVYKEDRWARVLCDGWGSCATKGHIVVWEGRAMMMARYCEEAVEKGCEEREMLVNSPRWTRGRRVAGRRGGLELTALAARWASRWEESVLQAMVYAGL